MDDIVSKYVIVDVAIIEEILINNGLLYKTDLGVRETYAGACAGIESKWIVCGDVPRICTFYNESAKKYIQDLIRFIIDSN